MLINKDSQESNSLKSIGQNKYHQYTTSSHFIREEGAHSRAGLHEYVGFGKRGGSTDLRNLRIHMIIIRK